LAVHISKNHANDQEQKQALSETNTVLASMKGKITAALEELESQLVRHNRNDTTGLSLTDMVGGEYRWRWSSFDGRYHEGPERCC
jgi:hypothetical protein